MKGKLSIEGFAIVSANGMIADCDCLMPNSLKLDADQQFFENALDNAAILVHGRKSHEGQSKSHLRRRVLLTKAVKSFEPDPVTPNLWLWNPAGASLDEVCVALGVKEGVVAILGGTAAYDMFLARYSAFHLCRAGKVKIPDGTPVLSEVSRGCSPEEVLRRAGLTLEDRRLLDPEHELTHECWRRDERDLPLPTAGAVMPAVKQ
jgi:hypothetical protein